MDYTFFLGRLLFKIWYDVHKLDIPVNSKHVYNICAILNRRRRWADVVQMLCKCFVFAGMDA